MKKSFHIDRSSLLTQLTLSYLALVFLTTTAVGLPAVLLIRNQVERQSWARVDQGNHATQALYDAWQRRIFDLALLTSQRPTLHQLVSEGQEDALLDYLQIIQEETELDLAVVCDQEQRLIASTDIAISLDMCLSNTQEGLIVLSSDSNPQVWMMAAHTVSNDSDNLGQVIVGMLLDDSFFQQMSAQSSLEHTLWIDKYPVASSFPGGSGEWRTAIRQPISDPTADIAIMPALLQLNDRPYYTARLTLDAPLGISDEIALDVADIVATERRLTWMLAGSIILVALVGSVLSVVMARRIGRPLTQLAYAVTAVSLGDLDTSISVPARVREVTQVAQALENARIDLHRTLTELNWAKVWTDNLLNTITEGIITLDGNGIITFFSPGAANIIGRSQSEALNQSCDELFRPTETDKSFRQMIPMPGQQGKITLRLEDDHPITLAVTSAQFASPDESEIGLVLVLRDVTKSEMIHHLLGEFLANVTHEFRTPLSALAVSTELLLDQALDLNPVELQGLLTSLYMGIVNLQTLIDNLLESASLEAGRFKVYPRPSDLGEIIAEATHMMQPLQEKYGQRLVVELPVAIPLVQADARRTVQVIVNLLSNAIKYSPDQTTITLSAVVKERWVRVAIADQGTGVPLTSRPKLFNRFVHQGTEDAKSRQGVGLGLSVVKAIVEAHNGQVGVDDRTGGGAVFWFTLPIVGSQ